MELEGWIHDGHRCIYCNCKYQLFFVFVNKLPRSDLFCLMSSDVLYVVVDVGSS